MKLKKAFMTFIKYVGWTAVGAAIQAAINYQWTGLLPDWTVLAISAGLKTVATYWKTKEPGV